MAILAQRRALMVAALGFARLPRPEPPPRDVAVLHHWLDSWDGLGAVVNGMTAQGFNAELREFPAGWRANFYPVGIAHSVVVGSAWETTAWRAVQAAAWEALNNRRPTDR
jgi:hypothetical protein